MKEYPEITMTVECPTCGHDWQRDFLLHDTKTEEEQVGDFMRYVQSDCGECQYSDCGCWDMGWTNGDNGAEK